jgi:hypothetical protein
MACGRTLAKERFGLSLIAKQAGDGHGPHSARHRGDPAGYALVISGGVLRKNWI